MCSFGFELRVGYGGHVHIFACECGTHVYSTRMGPGHERTCVFVCACECGTHVYTTRTGPGHGCVLSTDGVYGQNLYWACALHFHCVRAVRCSAWAVRAVYLVRMCVCVCTAVGMCRPSVVPLAMSTCMRALYSIGMVAWAACVVYMSVTCTYVLCVFQIEQCLAWLVRAMYLSCSCLYCACTIAQCVLCLYPLYSVLA